MWFICQNVFAAYTDRARLACHFVVVAEFSIVHRFLLSRSVGQYIHSICESAVPYTLALSLLVCRYEPSVWHRQTIQRQWITYCISVCFIQIFFLRFPFFRCARSFEAHDQNRRLFSTAKRPIHVKTPTEWQLTPDFVSRNTKTILDALNVPGIMHKHTIAHFFVVVARLSFSLSLCLNIFCHLLSSVCAFAFVSHASYAWTHFNCVHSVCPQS